MKENSIYNIVENIVTVVFYKHFSYITDNYLKEDLFQEGYLKAYELLNNGNYDPSMPLRNFIYTGVRNAMTNYLYHIKKETHMDIDELPKIDKYSMLLGVNDEEEPYIDLNKIKEVCDKYSKYGDYLTPTLIYLNNLGITNIKVNTNYNKELINNTLLDACITDVIWSLYENELRR